MPIYFYLPRDEWGWLSNFSPHGVELDGAFWPTVEHYFQAAKFVETDPPYAALIGRTSKPRDAARLGRDRGHPLRRDWEQVKDEIMRRGVQRKFEVHAELTRLLLDTGEEPLVEASPMDFYWGCGSDGSGQNRLGAILMEVRARLRAPPPAAVVEATAPARAARRKKGRAS